MAFGDDLNPEDCSSVSALQRFHLTFGGAGHNQPFPDFLL